MSAKTFLILIKRCYTSSNYPGRQLSAVPPLPLLLSSLSLSLISAVEITALSLSGSGSAVTTEHLADGIVYLRSQFTAQIPNFLQGDGISTVILALHPTPAPPPRRRQLPVGCSVIRPLKALLPEPRTTPPSLLTGAGKPSI